jgi:sporulation protein YlmC with PRC-barrel domain
MRDPRRWRLTRKGFTMLMAGSALKGYAIDAKDGRIGTVKDVLFDEKTWQVRWLVVDAGTWLTGRKVLIHPSAIAQADYVRQALHVTLTKTQVKDSPSIEQDRPVSKQMESSLYDYYGWDPVWGGSIFGGAAMTQAFGAPYGAGLALHEPVLADMRRDDGDPYLRSIDAATGYHIHAKDGFIGHVEDFLVDDAEWGIRYLIVDTRNWWPGKHVLIAPHAVTDLSWSRQRIDLNVSCNQVRQSPPWEPAELVDRAYEERLHSHYSWPGYGW